MGKRLVVTKNKGYIISALTDEENNIVDVSFDDTRRDNLIDNIYVGIVRNTLPNIHASFVEFKQGVMGFLPDIKKPGDKVLVQVVKDSIKGKEPVLTCEPTLTGRYVIFTCKNPGLHFSFKFRDNEKKSVIKEEYEKLGIEGCGFIIRTNALYVDVTVIISEILDYYKTFKDVENKWHSCKPYTLMWKSDISYIAYIKDSHKDEIESATTDDEEIYNDIKDFLEGDRIITHIKLKLYDKTIPSLSVVYNLTNQIKQALSEKVYLKSGAYIIIQQTEALVSIDVNSGRDISDKDSEEGYLLINVEAAKEVARQLRLRNLSGIIVVDFINMSNIKNKQILLETFKRKLDKDPMKPNVVDMTKLGLIEVTRKRVKKPLCDVLPKDFLE